MITPGGPWYSSVLPERAGAWTDWIEGLALPPGEPVLVGSAPETYEPWLAAVSTGHPWMPLGVRMTPGKIAACSRADESRVLAVEAEYESVARQVAMLSDQRVVVLPEQSVGTRSLSFDLGGDTLLMVLHSSGTTAVPKRVYCA